MKKKKVDENKVSVFWDLMALVASGVCVIVFLFIIAIIFIYDLDIKEGDSIKDILTQLYQFKWLKGSHGKAATGALMAVTLWPLAVFWLLYSLRRRCLDETGVSATYLGMTYRHIEWSEVQSVERKLVWQKKNKNPKECREILIFTSKPKNNGKPTVIKVELWDETMDAIFAVAKRYYMLPESVYVAASTEQDKIQKKV